MSFEPSPLRPFLYCPHCATRLAAEGTCPGCGRSHVLRPTPAVAMTVFQGDELLLVRRRWAPMAGHWALPAGYVERAEDPRSTVRREVYEETGLLVRPTGLLGAFPGGGREGRVVLLVYRGVVEGGRLEAGDDAAEVGFFGLDKLPKPLAYGPHRAVIEIVSRERHGRPDEPKKNRAGTT